MTHDPDLSDLSGEDAEVAKALIQGFSLIEFNRPAPVPEAQAVELISVSPGKQRRGSQRWYAIAASVTLALALATTLSPHNTSVAWANQPTAATSTDRISAVKACGAVIERGLGDLQSSFTQSVEPGSSPSVGTTSKVTSQPAELPPLAVLDIRGDGALAIFEDSNWTVMCLLKRTGNRWVDQGVTVTSASADPQPGTSFVSQTSWVGGDSVSIVGGVTPPSSTNVTFELSNGELVSASVLNGKFAAWFPGDTTVIPNSIVFQ